MLVRPALEADIGLLLDLQRAAIAAGYPSPLREALLDNPDICSAELRGRWSRGDVFLIAQQEDAILGFAGVTVPPVETELCALFVHPD